MDQRADHVEEDLKNILRTRLALGDKIQSLERRVEDTVRGTKAAALDVIESAKDQAVGWVESAAHRLDPSVQATRRPLMFLGGAVAIGVLAGLAGRRRRQSGVYPYYPPKTHGAEVMPSQQEERMRRGVRPFYAMRGPSSSEDRTPDSRRGSRSSVGLDTKPSGAEGGACATWNQLGAVWEELTGEFAREQALLQDTALHIGRSFVRDLARIVAQSLLAQLSGSSRSGRRSRPEQIA
ncbi:MAG TPA: hypothetical protein VJ746_03735 [Nitrospira sp.]|nr:hypothetical protein [Nitrospira sp.]